MTLRAFERESVIELLTMIARAFLAGMSGVSDETGQPILGTCPVCDDAIPSAYLLIKYEAAGEWPRLFAECPNCEDAVHPE